MRLARFLGAVAVFVLAMEVLVASYFMRDILTGMFWVLAAWPLLWPAGPRRRLGWIALPWTALCVITGLFTHLPVVSEQVTYQVYVTWTTGDRACVALGWR